jgi:hypothetical protein
VLDYVGAGLASQGLSYDDVLSATVEVARIPRDAKIEIAVIAGRR